MRYRSLSTMSAALGGGLLGLMLSGTPARAGGDPQAQPAPAAAAVAGNAERGGIRRNELYCDACHGVDGNSATPEWPTLAGQDAAYMMEQLRALRAGARPNAEMQPMAAPLADADIADLSAFYAARPLADGPADPVAGTAGAALYREGDPARGIPPCAACHGMEGRGQPELGSPALRAQQPVYTSRQLAAYANRTRYTDEFQPEKGIGNLVLMYEIAGKLTEEEIRSVSAYLRAMR